MSGQRLKMRTFGRTLATTDGSFLALGGGFGGKGVGPAALTCTGFLGGRAGGLGRSGIERHATFWLYLLTRSRTQPCAVRLSFDSPKSLGSESNTNTCVS